MPRLRLLFSLLLLPLTLSAEEGGPLYLELWCELDPLIGGREEAPAAREQTYRFLLEEAAEVLSGMIYGYEFRYTPSDQRRKVAEEFRLTAVARVPWGDPRLKILKAQERNRKLFARLGYDLLDFQADRRRAWSSNTLPLSSGRGEGNLFGGRQEKLRALQEAIKNAIRNHLRPILFNKPREIAGELVIWEPPRTIVQSGAYITEVAVKLRLEQVTPYRIF